MTLTEALKAIDESLADLDDGVMNHDLRRRGHGRGLDD